MHRLHHRAHLSLILWYICLLYSAFNGALLAGTSLLNNGCNIVVCSAADSVAYPLYMFATAVSSSFPFCWITRLYLFCHRCLLPAASCLTALPAAFCCCHLPCLPHRCAALLRPRRRLLRWTPLIKITIWQPVWWAMVVDGVDAVGMTWAWQTAVTGVMGGRSSGKQFLKHAGAFYVRCSTLAASSALPRLRALKLKEGRAPAGDMARYTRLRGRWWAPRRLPLFISPYSDRRTANSGQACAASRAAPHLPLTLLPSIPPGALPSSLYRACLAPSPIYWRMFERGLCLRGNSLVCTWRLPPRAHNIA